MFKFLGLGSKKSSESSGKKKSKNDDLAALGLDPSVFEDFEEDDFQGTFDEKDLLADINFDDMEEDVDDTLDEKDFKDPSLLSELKDLGWEEDDDEPLELGSSEKVVPISQKKNEETVPKPKPAKKEEVMLEMDFEEDISETLIETELIPSAKKQTKEKIPQPKNVLPTKPVIERVSQQKTVVDVKIGKQEKPISAPDEVQELKKQAVLEKKKGNIEKAKELLKKAKSLETKNASVPATTEVTKEQVPEQPVDVSPRSFEPQSKKGQQHAKIRETKERERMQLKQQRELIKTRVNEYRQAAVAEKKRGNNKKAMEYLKISREISALPSTKLVDASQIPDAPGIVKKPSTSDKTPQQPAKVPPKSTPQANSNKKPTENQANSPLLQGFEDEISPIENIVSNDVYEHEIETVIKNISAFKAKGKKPPEDLLERKQILETNMSILQIKVQTGQLTEEVYLNQLRSKMAEERERAKAFLKIGKKDFAAAALKRSKIIQAEKD